VLSGTVVGANWEDSTRVNGLELRGGDGPRQRSLAGSVPTTPLKVATGSVSPKS
jgi:hypothetical protein